MTKIFTLEPCCGGPIMADGERISQSPEFDLLALRRRTAPMHCPDVDRVLGVNHNMLKMLEKIVFGHVMKT